MKKLLAVILLVVVTTGCQSTRMTDGYEFKTVESVMPEEVKL